MKSQALEELELGGGEWVRYIPKVGGPKTIMALVDPMRRVDALGQSEFLTKTYELWIVKDPVDGLTVVVPHVDTVALKLHPTDTQDTVLKITKIYPERDAGVPGDGVGMWHLEAVA